MKTKSLLFLIVSLTYSTFQGFSQGAGIYIYSTDQTKLPGVITSGVHNGETKIDSYTRSLENTTTIGSTTGGSGAGRAESNGITIFKQYSKPSVFIKNMLFRSEHLTRMELRFYNSADQLYYRITLGTVFPVDFKEEGEGCPSGCPGMMEEIKFVFGAIREEDEILNISRCWSFITNDSTCP